MLERPGLLRRSLILSRGPSCRPPAICCWWESILCLDSTNSPKLPVCTKNLSRHTRTHMPPPTQNTMPAFFPWRNTATWAGNCSNYQAYLTQTCIQGHAEHVQEKQP